MSGRYTCLPGCRSNGLIETGLNIETTTTRPDEVFSLSSPKGGEGRGEEASLNECPSPPSSVAVLSTLRSRATAEDGLRRTGLTPLPSDGRGARPGERVKFAGMRRALGYGPSTRSGVMRHPRARAADTIKIHCAPLFQAAEELHQIAQVVPGENLAHAFGHG